MCVGLNIIMRNKTGRKINRMTELLLQASPEKRLLWVKKMARLCDYPHEKYVIYMLYIYGMRPAELMMLEKGHFDIQENNVRLFLPTVKGGDRRIIDLDIDKTPFMKWLVKYINWTSLLLPSSWKDTTNINGIFGKISRKNKKIRISPYVFRKYRLSYLAIEQDASAYDLQVWKGAKDMRSVQPYIRMKPLTKFGDKIR